MRKRPSCSIYIPGDLGAHRAEIIFKRVAWEPDEDPARLFGAGDGRHRIVSESPVRRYEPSRACAPSPWSEPTPPAPWFRPATETSMERPSLAGARSSQSPHLVGPDGSEPYAGLVMAADGNFYGTASSGGANNDGTVFRTPGIPATTASTHSSPQSPTSAHLTEAGRVLLADAEPHLAGFHQFKQLARAKASGRRLGGQAVRRPLRSGRSPVCHPGEFLASAPV